MFVLGSCNSKKQNNLCSMESYTIPKLVLKTYNSIDESAFFELCQLLNDSINNRQDYFYMRSANNVNIIINESTNDTTNEINLSFIEEDLKPRGLLDKLIFYICIKDEKTIFIQHKQEYIDNLKKGIKKFIFELYNLNKNIGLKKTHTIFFGEVESAKYMVIISINAKGNKLSSSEWLLFFKCLQEVVNVIEEERDSLSEKITGKKFNSLTFEEKVDILGITGYNIILQFDKECSEWQ